jgi:homotetrameric cytidine deaminase
MAARERRNVEVKAHDPDPERSLAVCRKLGAEDRGVLRQRDTYFKVPTGRLKLREEEPGEAHLVQYEREDATSARESRYRLVAVPDPGGLRAALDAALGTLVVVEKARRLLLWEGVRIHLDRVEGLGAFVELEGVAAEGSDLSAERARVEHLADALGLVEERRVATSYSDELLAARGAPRDLVAAARAAMLRAHAPYSGYRVGAALRAPDGSVHAGANVENAAYPQGQCAEASALGVLVAAGHERYVEAAVIADAARPAVPCGGCRQRLAELGAPDAAVHLCDRDGPRRTVTLAELLPLAFRADRLPEAGPGVALATTAGAALAEGPGLATAAGAALAEGPEEARAARTRRGAA